MYAIYAVNVSGGVSSSTCIFDDTSPALEHQLINPKLQLSAGAAGSLTITVPKTNAGFSAISRLTTTIKVKRDGTEIWRGRVLTESKDLWNNRVLFCEGCLAFLNDSIQSSSTAVTGQVSDYVSALLTNHNAKVASNRQVTLGTVSVEDPAGAISRYLNGETTLALLQKLVNELGGVLRTRFSGDTIYLDYLKEYPSSGTINLNTGELTKGYVLSTSGETGGASSTVSMKTGFIAIPNHPAGSRFKYSRTFYTNSTVTAGIAFYNSSQTYLSGVAGGARASANHYEDNTVDIPAGAAYVRMTALTNVSGFYASLVWTGGAAAQEIDLEENLLDFTRDWDNTDFCTVVLPRGARLQNEDSNLQSYLDISGATAPQYYTRIDTTDAVYLSKNDLYNPEYPSNGYGRIEKVVDFSDIGSGLDPTSDTYAADLATAKGRLMSAAADYLANQQYDGMTLELTAVDMHMVNPTTAAWNLLDKVKVKAVPYFNQQGKTFAIVGMQIPLDAPEKTKYTLGPDSAPKVRRVLSLTKQQNQAAQELEKSISNSSSYTEKTAVSKARVELNEQMGTLRVELFDEDDGIITRIDARVGGIETYVGDETIGGSYSTLSQLATGIFAKVYDGTNDQWSVITFDGSTGLTIGNGSGTLTNINGGFLDADTIHVHQLFGNTITLNDDNDSPHSYIYLRDSSHAIYPGVLEIQAPNGGIALEAQYGNLYLHGSQRNDLLNIKQIARV